MGKTLYIIGNGFDLAHAALPGAKEKGFYKTRYPEYRDMFPRIHLHPRHSIIITG